jgi:hypothetical protein
MKRKTHRARLLQRGAELKAWDQVIAAILPLIRNWRGGRECAHPLAKTLCDDLEPGLFEAIHPVSSEGRKHVIAGIVENAVIYREQQVVDRSIDAAGRVMRGLSG